MKYNILIGSLAALLLQIGESNAQVRLLVRNKLGIARNAEIVSISLEKTGKKVKFENAEQLGVREADKKEYLVTQTVDLDGDGKPEEILFPSSLRPNEGKSYILEVKNKDFPALVPGERMTYNRFVPERAKDYAWENDRVAFRIYGSPGRPGSGGGIDAFLKRVEYPVINRWYKNNAESEGAYHIDSGEGYDPYQVGRSRGIGGTGVWINDSLYVPANFTGHRMIAAGPLRSIFELTYDTWDAGGFKITEKKRLSLDLGDNLTRHEIYMQSDKSLPNITAGLTLHDKKGEVKINQANGWFRYWEPMDDSFLGTGIVIAPDLVQESKDLRKSSPDQSHILVIGKAMKMPLIFYAGFGWQKSRQFNDVAAWDKYLADFALRISSPLEVVY